MKPVADPKESWGKTIEWECGHQALVLDPTCDFYDHAHWCPVCVGKVEPDCKVEYLDIAQWKEI